MAKFADLVTQLQHGPVFLVTVMDLIFLVVLLFVFRYNYSDEIRTVIKDSFIGWNGALALAINVINRESTSMTNTTVSVGTHQLTPPETKTDTSESNTENGKSSTN